MRYRFDIDPSDPDHQSARAKINRKLIKGSSFAADVVQDRWTVENGVEVRYLVELDLIDVSPVYNPAYGKTTAMVRSEDHTDDAFASWEKWQTQLRLDRMQDILKK